MGFTNQHIVFLTSGHKPTDPRLYFKEIQTLKGKYNNISIIAPYHKRYETVDDVKIFGIQRYRSRYFRFGSMRSLYSEAVKIKPQIIHCHEPDSLFVSYLLKRKLKRIKVIYDCHEFHPETFTQHFPFLFRVLFRVFFKSLIAMIENYMVSKIDGVITVNEILVDRFRKYNKCVLLLPNYPRVASFKSHSCKRVVMSSKQVTLIYAGALSVNRGMLLMLDVIKELDSSINAKLVVMGKFASSDNEKLFYKKMKEDSLYKKVVYKGDLPWEETVHNLFEADIGLFLVSNKKRYHWGEPVKYFEYSAAGLPVIITDLPAKRKLINKNKNGMLVSPYSVNEAIRAIKYLINNPKEARNMSENGKNSIFQEYSWESIEKDLIHFYAQMH
jgi:hypothetical protein